MNNLWPRLAQRIVDEFGGRLAAGLAAAATVSGVWAVAQFARMPLAITLPPVAIAVAILAVYLRWRLWLEDDLATLLLGGRWLNYDPVTYDPDAALFPSEPELVRDLRAIANARTTVAAAGVYGFRGIVTFSSEDTLCQIPRLARQCGLEVIMGVWDPGNKAELRLAWSQRRHVAAYVVGHNGLGTRYSVRTVAKAIRMTRRRTRKAVTTTERFGSYLDTESVARMGDWMFPDVHPSFATRTTPATAAKAIIDAGQRLASLRKQDRRAILLKMVTYPVAGLGGASLHAQRVFFEKVFEDHRDVDRRLPARVSIAVHSAFDSSWKWGPRFYDWDSHTGVFEPDGSPRPAVPIILGSVPQ